MIPAPRKDAALAMASAEAAAGRPDRIVTVLAITHHKRDYFDLLRIFSHSNWRIYRSESRREALAILHETPVAIVLCEAGMEDGSWRDVLADVAALPDRPLVIVASDGLDRELWAEVLNLGGYDVLIKPFEPAEVVRIISLAWLHWREAWVQAHGVRRLAAALAAAS